MDDKSKELIAIGASLTANCHPCLQYHVGKARELGVGEQEIAEAVEVGKAVRKGAASKMDVLAAQLSRDNASIGEEKDAGCGCGS